MQNPKYRIPDLESSWIFNLEGISGELLLLLPMEGWMLRWASESIPAQEKSTSGMLAIGRSTYGRSTSGRQGPASTWYSTRTRNFLSYSNSTRTKHYSDRVVSSINSRNFRIFSTIQVWWASNIRRTLSLSFKSWEESLHALNPLLSFINTFPFYQI